MVKMMNEKYLYLCKNYHRVSLIYRKDRVSGFRVSVEDEKGKVLSVATGLTAEAAICLAYYQLHEFKDLK